MKSEEKRDETRVENGQTDERKCTPGGRETERTRKGELGGGKTRGDEEGRKQKMVAERETEVGECAESERDGELEEGG